MRIRRLTPLAATVAIGLVAGCGIIGGIEEIKLVDEVSDAGADDAEADALPRCDLPSDGNAFLRLGVLVPTAGSYDFCIKPKDGSFDEVEPLFAIGGPGCPTGLRYKDLTVAFRVPSGSYDVRMVPAGATDCSKSQGDLSVEAIEDRATTVLGFAESGGTALRGLPESPVTFGRSQVRFIHALAGYDALDCGATDSSRLPANIVTPVFSDVSFGAVAPAGVVDLGSIDANGYLSYSFAGGTVRFAIAQAEQADALVTLETRFALNSSHSLFAIGRVGDAAFPPALWSCDESATPDGILASCGNPLDLSVEVFSAQLTDLFTPLYRARIDPVNEALQAASSDVICVNEVRSPAKLEALLAATKETYPHGVATFQLTPSESDLTDQSGSMPAPYATPACAGDGATELLALMDCIDENCAQDDGSGHYFKDDGNVGADCVAKACSTEATPLLLGAPDKKACWMCALTQMASEETTEWVRQACSEDPDARYAYRGSLGLAVLSKHPIGDAKSWLLPSTGWQRGALHAPIDLPNGVPLDFYCSDLTVPEAGILFPYAGQYGGEAEGDKRWVAEQLLQAQRLVGIIDENTGDSGARIVLGITAYAGPQDGSLAAQSPEVYGALTTAFAPLVPPGYVSACTQCIDNPVFSGLDPGDVPAADTWTSHLLGRGIPPSMVKVTEVTFREASYDVIAPEGARAIPPSSQYGLRSVIRITQ